MRWRCVDCGRLHDERGGRCACGGEEFERLVVQVTKRCTSCGEPVPEATTRCPECGFTGFEPLAAAEDARPDRSYLEWRCASCGRAHPKNNPPCSRCGHESLERHRVEGDDVGVDDVVAEELDDDSLLASLRARLGSDDERAPVDGSYVEWRCGSCGRAHPKNNPPCSRCGHESLERHRVEAGDVAVEETPDAFGVDDALIAGFDRTTVAGVALVVVVFVLIWAFVPGAALPGTGGPWVAAVNQSALEAEVVAGLNDERASRDRAVLSRSPALASAADALATDAAAGEQLAVGDATDCAGARAVYRGLQGDGEWPGEGDPTPERVAAALLADVFADDRAAERLTAANVTDVGVGSTVDDDNRLHVVIVVC